MRIRNPAYDTPATAGKKATAGMSARAGIPAATGMPALSKGHQQKKAQNASNSRICVVKLQKWQEMKPEIWP
jgi:hypothetical protein